jgi:hypothetical protein
MRTTTATANGSRLLEAVNYNRYLFASIIAQRDDWEELLDSIPAPDLRRNAAGAVLAIREALALPAQHAFDLCQGRECPP